MAAADAAGYGEDWLVWWDDGMQKRPFREPVRVEFHLSEGVTRVVYERVPNSWLEIPTADIPPHLRHIGSRFILVGNGITPEKGDSIEEIRAAILGGITDPPNAIPERVEEVRRRFLSK